MRGREIRGFTVEVSRNGITKQRANVTAGVDAEELCHTVTQTQLGQIYYFKVWVISSRPNEIVQLMLNTTGIGRCYVTDVLC